MQARLYRCHKRHKRRATNGRPSPWAWHVVLGTALACGSVLAALVPFAAAQAGALWLDLEPASGPPGRYLHAMVTAAPAGVLVLGGLGTGGALNDVWSFTEAGAWKQSLPTSSLWAARYGHAAAVLPSGDVLVLGGQIGSTGSKANDVTGRVVNSMISMVDPTV